MDNEYRAYFSERSQEVLTDRPVRRAPTLGRAYPEDRSAHVVASSAVDAARRELPHGVQLRPDAELAIYFLVSELVAMPVLALQPNAGPELAADVAVDASTVTRVAASSLTDGDDPEVTAHGVIDALSRSWRDLRTARWRVWDRHSE